MVNSQASNNPSAVEWLEAKAERLARELLTATQLLDMARRQAHSWKQRAEKLQAALDRAEDDAGGWTIAAAAWQARARALEAKERPVLHGTPRDEVQPRAEESAAREHEGLDKRFKEVNTRCNNLKEGNAAAHARIGDVLDRVANIHQEFAELKAQINKRLDNLAACFPEIHQANLWARERLQESKTRVDGCLERLDELEDRLEKMSEGPVQCQIDALLEKVGDLEEKLEAQERCTNRLGKVTAHCNEARMDGEHARQRVGVHERDIETLKLGLAQLAERLDWAAEKGTLIGGRAGEETAGG